MQLNDVTIVFPRFESFFLPPVVHSSNPMVMFQGVSMAHGAALAAWAKSSWSSADAWTIHLLQQERRS
eukprot:3327947-Pyramimonas_sp.AAC.1